MSKDLLKLLIIDDEYLVRSLLRNCMDWEALGYEIVGEAAGAHEALELVDCLKPDVIFTDICMPFMDGIEFSKIVYEKYPLIKIVVLTGYGEFDYAKRSIKIGISDFLLKPINDDEIRKVALNIKEKIESEFNHRTEYNRLKKHLEENKPYLRERLLNQLLQHSFKREDVLMKLDYLNIKINMDYIQLAVVDVYHVDLENDIGEEEKLFLKMQSIEMVEQYFRDDAFVNVFFDSSQKIVILNSDKTVDITECLEALKSMLINKLRCFASIGIGNRYNSEEKVKISYKEACNALDYKVIAGKNQVINYCDINFSTEQFNVQNDQIDAFTFFMKAGMRTKALELLDTVFNESAMGLKNRIESIRVTASSIVSVVLGVIADVGMSISEVFILSGQPFDEVFRIDTFPDMKNYLKTLINSTIEKIENMQTKKVNQAVKQVQDYIDENLTNSEISLSNTAKNFYMNMSYLSRIFKLETGQTFVEYLTKARMEKAMKLLRETDMKAYQVAEYVGIVDPHYFGICFKKYTGVSVNDFKKG